MLKLVILLSSLAYALSMPATKSLKAQPNGRIVGGVATTIISIPWQISIQKAGSHFCGGSIYSDRIIVTAAHCLYYQTAAKLKIRAGSSFWNSGGVYIQVEAIKVHEDYDPDTMENDVAVMRLATPLTFKSTLKPIPLATVTPGDGVVAVASGWGTTTSGTIGLPTQVRSVDVNIVGLSKCTSEAYSYGEQIYESMICSYSEDKDSCQGDSGGPLVADGKLVGIVSWGYGCAFRNFPGVYANVANLRTWIEAAAVSF